MSHRGGPAFPNFIQLSNCELLSLYVLLKFRELSNLLVTSAYLSVITRSEVLIPTHFLFARYPHPKSLPSGKGLTFALSGSKSGVSRLRNLSVLFLFVEFEAVQFGA